MPTPAPHPAPSHDATAGLVSDLAWFSARAAELAAPRDARERALLDRYQSLIAHRRHTLLARFSRRAGRGGARPAAAREAEAG